MKPSHTSPGQARKSLLWWPCSEGFRGPRRPRIIGPITRFACYSSMRQRSRPRARYPDDVSSTPASTRPQSDPTRTCQSTRRSTMTRATPWMPAGVPAVMRGRRLAVATTLVVAYATITARTEARAPTCRDLRPLANTSSTPSSHRGTYRRPTSRNTWGNEP